MFGILKLTIRITLSLLAILLVVAFFTNPSKLEFGEKVKTELNAMIREQTNNPALGYIAELGSAFTGQVAEKMVTRENYYLCSVFTIELPDGEYRYLGALHMFFPMQSKDPLASLKQSLK